MNHVEAASLEQWRAAGGHVLPSTDSPVARDSQRAFVLLQSAAALDAACSHARQELRALNSEPSISVAAPPAPLSKQVGAYEDDHSDGSELQGGLVARNVRPDKAELVLRPGSNHTAPNGTLRLLRPNLLSPAECELLVAGGLVAMAGAFSRCGQTTLGVSPALAARTRLPQPEGNQLEGSAAGEGATPAVPTEDTVPLLYRTVERVRRAVASAFGEALGSLRVSDATLTRLQPVHPVGDVLQSEATEGQVSSAAALRDAVSSTGALDVGVLRGDHFCYWRPHLDQVSSLTGSDLPPS